MISPLFPHLQTGFLFRERYEILGSLSNHTLSVVYQAWDTYEGTYVALKESPYTAIAAREAHFHKYLKHSRIPRLRDFFSCAGYEYLVMDFIHGQTLEEYLQTTELEFLSLDEVVDIGSQLSAIFGYVHNHLVFRDLHPGNVLLSGRSVHLIDLGCATWRSLERQQSSWDPFGVRGIENDFTAPEVVRGEAASPQSDIYSLGVLLADLLTGEVPPFSFSRTDDLQRKELQVLLESMMQKCPARRPIDMHAVHRQLTRVVSLQASCAA